MTHAWVWWPAQNGTEESAASAICVGRRQGLALESRGLWVVTVLLRHDGKPESNPIANKVTKGAWLREGGEVGGFVVGG